MYRRLQVARILATHNRIAFQDALWAYSPVLASLSSVLINARLEARALDLQECMLTVGGGSIPLLPLAPRKRTGLVVLCIMLEMAD